MNRDNEPKMWRVGFKTHDKDPFTSFWGITCTLSSHCEISVSSYRDHKDTLTEVLREPIVFRHLRVQGAYKNILDRDYINVCRVSRREIYEIRDHIMVYVTLHISVIWHNKSKHKKLVNKGFIKISVNQLRCPHLGCLCLLTLV